MANVSERQMTRTVWSYMIARQIASPRLTVIGVFPLEGSVCRVGYEVGRWIGSGVRR